MAYLEYDKSILQVSSQKEAQNLSAGEFQISSSDGPLSRYSWNFKVCFSGGLIIYESNSVQLAN